MKERHRHKVDALLAHAPGLRQFGGVRHALVGQHHALGQTGGARCVEDQRDLVRRAFVAGVGVGLSCALGIEIGAEMQDVADNYIDHVGLRKYVWFVGGYSLGIAMRPV